jgi:sugar phosphate isomerase/epimerase
MAKDIARNRHGAAVFVKVTKDTLDEVQPFAQERQFDLEIVDLIKPQVFWNELDSVLAVYLSRLEDQPGTRSLHGPFIDLYLHSLDLKVAELSRVSIEQTLELSDKLSVAFTIFHGNFLPLIDQDSYRRHWVRTHSEYWSRVCKNFRTTVLLENLWDRTPELFLEVLEQVGSPSLGMCLDIAHCTVYSPLDLEDWLRALGPYIKILHINDNDGVHDFEWPPGRGVTNWQRVTDLVARYCVSPHVSLELSTREDVDEAFRFMRSNGIYPFN